MGRRVGGTDERLAVTSTYCMPGLLLVLTPTLSESPMRRVGDTPQVAQPLSTMPCWNTGEPDLRPRPFTASCSFPTHLMTAPPGPKTPGFWAWVSH